MAYSRWDGSGLFKALVVVIDTWRRHVGDKVRQNINAVHAQGGKGGYLGGSRTESVEASGGIEAPNWVDVIIDWRHVTGLTVQARVEVYTPNAATSVTPRVRDVTNGVNYDGTASTTVDWDEQIFDIDAPAVLDVIRYRFYLVANNNTHPVRGIGVIEVHDELYDVA